MRSWLAWGAALVVFACGPKNLQQRMAESEALASDADDLLTKAEEKMRDLEPDDAQELLDEAKEVMLKPNADLHPEWTMTSERLKRDASEMPAVREARKKRDLEQKAKEREESIAKVVERHDQAIEGLEAKAPTRANLEAHAEAVKELQDALAESKELEKEAPTWAAKAKSLRARIAEGQGLVPAAKIRVEFAEGPVAALDEAKDAIKQLKEASKPAEKAEAQKALVRAYERCLSSGKQLIARHPGVALTPLPAKGKTVLPTALLNDCERALGPAKKQLKTLQKAAKPKK